MDEFHAKFTPPDTGEWYSTQPLNFIPKLNYKRNEENPPILFTAEQAADHVASRYGQPNCTLLEALLPNTRAKPYFDFEMYLDEEADTRQILQQQVLPPILRSLEAEAEDVRLASRHGWVKKDGRRKFKVSFRVFIQGKWLPVQNMNTIIGRPEFADRAWDKTVYPKQGERMMAVVGGVKGKNGDVRVLEPVKEGYAYHEYLIQGLDGNEEEMDVLPPKNVTKVPKNGIHSMDAASGHVTEKPSWLSLLMDEEMVNLATDFMIAKGMRNFKTGRISGNTLQILNELGNLRICMHGQMHRSNNASVLFFNDGKVMYRCYSSKCFDKDPCEIGTWSVVLPTSMDEMSEGELMKINVEMAKQLINSNRERLAVQYMNRFLIAVGISHPEVVMLEFNEKGEVKDYVIRTFAETGTWMAPGGRAFQVWKESSARREVRKYQWELKQDNCAPDKFNLFTGKLPMSHVDQEDMVTEEDLAYIQPILQHIRLHFCNGEDELADYLLNWLAFPLQHLGQKTGVAVVIKGLPGTGKGLIINHLMSAIYGEHYC
ncbi:g5492 [Coccomyxa elongata]